MQLAVENGKLRVDCQDYVWRLDMKDKLTNDLEQKCEKVEGDCRSMRRIQQQNENSEQHVKDLKTQHLRITTKSGSNAGYGQVSSYMMLKRQNEAKDVELKEEGETIAKKMRAIEDWKSTLDNYKAKFGEEISRSHGNRDLERRLMELRQQSKEDLEKLFEKNKKLEGEVKKLKKNFANAEKGCQDEKDAPLKQVDTAEKSMVAAQTDCEKEKDARLRLQSIHA